jgi:hypothetical protein
MTEPLAHPNKEASLDERIRARFASFGGVELELPPRLLAPRP